MTTTAFNHLDKTATRREVLLVLLHVLRQNVDALRQKDVFDIDEVEYAIVETNGTLSVLLKPENRNITLKNLGKSEKDQGLPCAVVIDGKIIGSAFKDCFVTQKEVESRRRRETDDIRNILLMTVDRNKKYNIIFKKED